MKRKPDRAEMNVEEMKSMLRRKFSISRIQRPRIAITRASTESDGRLSTGELDIVRALKVSVSAVHSLH